MRSALMAEREIGAVLVMNEDGLVAGIFTERDLLMRVVHAGLHTTDTPISLVMTRNVRFVSPGTTVEAAMALMHINRHRHLLVIDGPTVHGLVSMRDLVYQIVRRGPQGFAAALQNTPRHSRHGSTYAPSPARRAALAAGLGSFALLASRLRRARAASSPCRVAARTAFTAWRWVRPTR